MRTEPVSRKKETAMASVHFWGSYRTCYKALLKYLKPDWEGTKLKLKRFVQRLLKPFKGQGHVLRLITRASAKAILIGCLFSGFGGTPVSLNPQDMERLESMIHIEVAGRQQELVVFDPTVKELPVLLKGFSRDVRYLVLDGKRDGLAQIQAELERNGDIHSLHLIAHGDPGEIRLGTTVLNEEALIENGDALKAISSRMTHARDILLYSCRTGYGADGRRFVKKMRSITGVDIAASDNLTGAQSKGGDWDLEITAGQVETPAPFIAAALEKYRHVLATITVTNANAAGAGSLRQAITDAASGDTITFNSGYTIILGTQLTIGKDLTIDGDLDDDGTPDVILDANHDSRVLEITSGTVTLQGLVIRDGLLSGNGGRGIYDGESLADANASDSFGAGIYNSGTLTILDSIITNNVATGGGGGGNGVTGGSNFAGYGGGGGSGFDRGGGNGGYGSTLFSDGAGSDGGIGIGGGGGGCHAGAGATGGYSWDGAVRVGGDGGTTSGGAGGLTCATAPAAGGHGGTAGAAGGGGGGSSYGFYGDGGEGGGAGGAAVGGIYNAGTLFVARTTFSDNLGAGGGGGGGRTTSGAGGMGVGAVYNAGTLSYQSGSTTFSDNDGAGGYGGGGGAQETSSSSDDTSGNAANSTWTPPSTNDAPTVSGAPASVTVVEDTLSNINLSSVTFADSDGDSLTVTLAVSAGTFSTPADGSGVGSGVTETLVNPTTITLAGAAADINTYLDTATNIKYTGAGDASGTAAATLTLSATDGSGSLASDPVVNIDITGVDDDPSLDSLAAASVDENGTVHLIGTYSDADGSDTHELEIYWGEGSPETVAVSGGTFDITHQYLDDDPTATAADIYTIDVTLTDNNASTDTGSTTTTISNVAPDDLILSSSSVVENASVNTTVGFFTATDVGSLDTFTYRLVAGGGDTDNASFNISGNELRTSAVFDREIKDSCSILVETTDDDGGTYEETFAISVSDVNEEPTLTATGSSPAFTEAGPAVGLFSATAISAIESAQEIASMELTVTNVAGDGSEERLVIDGTDVALSDGSNVTTAANSFVCFVLLSDGTATVTIAKVDTTANWQTLINSLSYQHTGSSIDSNSRVATVTTLVDAGSNTGGNDNINDSLSVASTISMISTAPTVTTLAATNVAATTATGNGNITDLGVSDPTEHGVCWSTTADPTTADSITTEGAASSTGAFTSDMTGLSAGTTYHYRSYATNAAGTSYGADETFTTSAPPAAPSDDSGCSYSAGTGNSFASFIMMIFVFSVWFVRRSGRASRKQCHLT